MNLTLLQTRDTMRSLRQVIQDKEDENEEMQNIIGEMKSKLNIHV